MAKQFTKQEVLSAMRKTLLMSLAVSDKENQPQSHVMLFSIDDDFTIYFTTSKDSSKHRALKENNKVGISVWVEKEMLIQIPATVEELNGNEALDAVDKLAISATEIPNFWPPVLQLMKENYVVYKSKPISIRALDLTTTTITSSSTLFTNIGVLI